jgi:hypothetical protein
MPSSGMLRRVALVRTEVSVERIASISRVTRIRKLETLAVTNNRSTLRRNTHIVVLRRMRRLLVTANVVPSQPILVILMMETVYSSETSALTRVTSRNIPENYIILRF